MPSKSTGSRLGNSKPSESSWEQKEFSRGIRLGKDKLWDSSRGPELQHSRSLALPSLMLRGDHYAVCPNQHRKESASLTQIP